MVPVSAVRGRGSTAAGAAANWWEVAGQTCVAAYQPKGAADLAASYVNLANPGTYNAAPGTAPSFATATGWTFTAASSTRLTTGIDGPSDQTWSMIIRFSNGGLGKMAGYEGAGVYFNLAPQADAGTRVGYTNQSYLVVAPPMTEGVICVAGNRGYRNGTQESGTISGGNSNIGLLHIGWSGATGSYYTGNIQAIAIYSTTLSASDVAALTTAMNAL